MIVDPLIRGYICRDGIVIVDAVYKPMNFVRPPFNSEGVVIVCHGFTQVIGVTERLPARVAGAVERTKDLVRDAADIFHDVNLARLWPVNLANVGAECPESRPEAAFARRHQHTCFDATIFKLCLVPGDKPC